VSEVVYSSLKKQFVGLDTQYPLATGKMQRRIYLDSGASSLMFRPAMKTVAAYLAHYANTHTTVHSSAKITSAAMAWANEMVLDFVNAPAPDYVCAFLGSGTTAAANRVAQGLAATRAGKEVVLVSSMEHHSNDLPHRHHSKIVEHIPLVGEGAHPGQVDLDALEGLLKRHAGKVNYIAVTGVSNVTGILNPLADMAQLAHAHGALMVVDGAQMVAHAPVDLAGCDIDFFIFSGHKVYAPGSPGVMVGRRELVEAMSPTQLGGGMVGAVSKWGYDLATSLEDREQAGTPNIPGTLALACVLSALNKLGMDEVFEREKALAQWTLQQFANIPGVTVYGDLAIERVGTITFNVDGVGHGLVAAILNDYHGIAVRNECFCAHPYVQDMLKDSFSELAEQAVSLDNAAMEALFQVHRGMVRASFGLYTDQRDIEQLVAAVSDISQHADQYCQQYQALASGQYQHIEYNPVPEQLFDIEQTLNQFLR